MRKQNKKLKQLHIYILHRVGVGVVSRVCGLRKHKETLKQIAQRINLSIIPYLRPNYTKIINIIIQEIHEEWQIKLGLLLDF